MFKFKGQKKTENAGGETAAQANPGPEETIGSGAIKRKLSGNMDIIINEIALNGISDFKFTVVFVDGMVNSQLVDDFVLKPIIQEKNFCSAKSEQEIIDLIMVGNVYHDQRKLRRKLSDCLFDILSGSVALIFDNVETAVTFELKGFERRSLTEPSSESVLKGSKECFIEVLRINTGLIRHRIQTSELKIEQLQLGRRTKTAVSVVYLEGVANQKIADEIKRRLSLIDIDGIVSAGIIEATLTDNFHSFFPQMLYTERVDKFCSNILEGRIGVLADGIPISYIMPIDISAFLQAPEDYSINYIASSLFRILRYLSALISLTLPAVYVAITTFHQEMIPTELASSIIESKQGVPFPSYLEVLLMLFSFEVLLEAGLRLPKSIGQAVSIVGGLVVGQAAISANIMSPAVVIVIATAGITGFTIPSQDMANTLRICRLILVIASIIGGLFSVSIALTLILYHLCSLETFGVPYMSPFVASEGKNMFNDTIIKKSWLKTKTRPANICPEDIKRQV